VVISDALQGMPVAVLDGARKPVRAAHFDPSARRVVSASWDGTARVWDATAPYRRWRSPSINDEDCGLLTSLEPDQRFVAIGCRAHPTQVWDTSREQMVAELPSVTPVEGDFTGAYPAVSKAGDLVAIARGSTVAVYAVPGDRLVRTIVHGAPVNAVAFATTGHDIVSGAVDGSLIVTRENGAQLVLPASSSGIDAVGFLSDGRIVAADAQRHLRVYDPGGARVADLEASGRVRMLRVSSDGSRLVTVPNFIGKVEPADLWDVESYQRIAKLEEAQVSARFVGDRVLTAGMDAVRLWDGVTGLLLQTYRGGPRTLVDAALSTDGSMVIAGDGDGLLRFWDASSGLPLWTMPAHRSYVIGIRVDGDDIVTRGFFGDISKWTLPKPEQTIEAFRARSRAMPPK
jgi:WD40 repeat protein